MRSPSACRRHCATPIGAICSSVCAREPPRVHCITNQVAQTFTANMLLALGAQPSMTISPEEIAHFVARADALLVNLGTFDAEAAAAAIEIAVAAAQKRSGHGCSIRC